jgi:hypothetical protein
VQQFRRLSLNIALKFQSVEALARQLLIREQKTSKPRWGGGKKEGTGR